MKKNYMFIGMVTVLCVISYSISKAAQVSEELSSSPERELIGYPRNESPKTVVLVSEEDSTGEQGISPYLFQNGQLKQYKSEVASQIARGSNTRTLSGLSTAKIGGDRVVFVDEPGLISAYRYLGRGRMDFITSYLVHGNRGWLKNITNIKANGRDYVIFGDLCYEKAVTLISFDGNEFGETTTLELPNLEREGVAGLRAIKQADMNYFLVLEYGGSDKKFPIKTYRFDKDHFTLVSSLKDWAKTFTVFSVHNRDYVVRIIEASKLGREQLAIAPFVNGKILDDVARWNTPRFSHISSLAAFTHEDEPYIVTASIEKLSVLKWDLQRTLSTQGSSVEGSRFLGALLAFPEDTQTQKSLMASIPSHVPSDVAQTIASMVTAASGDIEDAQEDFLGKKDFDIDFAERVIEQSPAYKAKIRSKDQRAFDRILLTDFVLPYLSRHDSDQATSDEILELWRSRATDRLDGQVIYRLLKEAADSTFGAVKNRLTSFMESHQPSVIPGLYLE